MLDKYYTTTKTAQHCVEVVKRVKGFNYDVILEPSAGSGSFFDLLPSHRLGLDIAPEHPQVIQQDYFNWSHSADLSYLVIGNPPFGTNASLAKAFFNYSARFAATIAFILPRTFRKLSVQNQLDLWFSLEYDEVLPVNSFVYEGKPYPVPCTFQIWSRTNVPRQKVVLPVDHSDWLWSNPSKADISIRRVGALAGSINHNLNYSPSSNYFILSRISPEVLKSRFHEMRPRLAEMAKDTVGNPSIGKAEIVSLYKQLYD